MCQLSESTGIALQNVQETLIGKLQKDSISQEIIKKVHIFSNYLKYGNQERKT